MDPNDSGYASPRTTQDPDRSTCYVEVPPGIREALYTKTKKKISIIITELHLLSIPIAWETGHERHKSEQSPSCATNNTVRKYIKQ